MDEEELIEDMARLIFNAAWAVTGLKYEDRPSNWRAKDARRAAEFILTKYDVTRRSHT